MKSLTNQDVMITGSNGFVGSHLCDYLKKKGINVIKVSLSKINGKKINLDFSNHIDWTESLLNVKCIIHSNKIFMITVAVVVGAFQLTVVSTYFFFF